MVFGWVRNNWTWLNNIVVRIENSWKWLKMFVVWTRSQHYCQGTKRFWSSQSTFLVWLRCIQKKRWDKKYAIDKINWKIRLIHHKRSRKCFIGIVFWKVNFIRTSTSASSPFLLFFASHHPHHPQVKIKVLQIISKCGIYIFSFNPSQLIIAISNPNIQSTLWAH